VGAGTGAVGGVVVATGAVGAGPPGQLHPHSSLTGWNDDS
jgi:hypothetical protein